MTSVCRDRLDVPLGLPRLLVARRDLEPVSPSRVYSKAMRSTCEPASEARAPQPDSTRRARRRRPARRAPRRAAVVDDDPHLGRHDARAAGADRDGAQAVGAVAECRSCSTTTGRCAPAPTGCVSEVVTSIRSKPRSGCVSRTRRKNCASRHERTRRHGQEAPSAASTAKRSYGSSVTAPTSAPAAAVLRVLDLDPLDAAVELGRLHLDLDDVARPSRRCAVRRSVRRAGRSARRDAGRRRRRAGAAAAQKPLPGRPSARRPPPRPHARAAVRIVVLAAEDAHPSPPEFDGERGARLALLRSLRRFRAARASASVGKSTTSRIVSRPVRSIASRSIPKPRPPVGGHAVGERLDEVRVALLRLGVAARALGCLHREALLLLVGVVELAEGVAELHPAGEELEPLDESAGRRR